MHRSSEAIKMAADGQGGWTDMALFEGRPADCGWDGKVMSLTLSFTIPSPCAAFLQVTCHASTWCSNRPKEKTLQSTLLAGRRES
jgi:hypothetical protein